MSVNGSQEHLVQYTELKTLLYKGIINKLLN